MLYMGKRIRGNEPILIMAQGLFFIIWIWMEIVKKGEIHSLVVVMSIYIAIVEGHLSGQRRVVAWGLGNGKPAAMASIRSSAVLAFPL